MDGVRRNMRVAARVCDDQEIMNPIIKMHFIFQFEIALIWTGGTL